MSEPNCENCCFKVLFTFWNKHKKTVFSIIKWSFCLLFFGAIVPLIIDWAYQTPAIHPIFSVSWKVEDALSFYGSLLGSAATIYVLMRTIKFTVENQREERRLSIKPYLETTKYGYTDPLKVPDDQGIIYLTLSKRGCIYQGSLPEYLSNLKKQQQHLKDLLSIDPLDQVAFDFSKETIVKTKYHLLYEVSNCGAENAVNVQFLVDKYDPLPSFAITTEHNKRFILILNKDLLDENSHEYTLEIRFTYDDIASLTHYSQHERITFKQDKNGELKTSQKSSFLLSKPFEIPQEAV